MADDGHGRPVSGGAGMGIRGMSNPLSDTELADLALAADPDTQVGPDAVCLWSLAGWDREQLLPGW